MFKKSSSVVRPTNLDDTSHFVVIFWFVGRKQIKLVTCPTNLICFIPTKQKITPKWDVSSKSVGRTTEDDFLSKSISFFYFWLCELKEPKIDNFDFFKFKKTQKENDFDILRPSKWFKSNFIYYSPPLLKETEGNESQSN